MLIPVTPLSITPGLQRLTLPVKGMTCASCVANVERALKDVDGVASVSVNLATEKALVEANPRQATAQVLAQALDNAGYAAETDTLTLNVGGMTCGAVRVPRLQRPGRGARRDFRRGKPGHGAGNGGVPGRRRLRLTTLATRCSGPDTRWRALPARSSTTRWNGPGWPAPGKLGPWPGRSSSAAS